MYLRKRLAKAWADPALRIELTVPVEVKSDQSMKKGGGWAVEYRYKVRQQEHLGGYLKVSGLEKSIPHLISTTSKCRVILTRLGCPQTMDRDNLARSFKHVRDQIARLLGRDDRDNESLVWEYEQMPKEKPGIRIVIERFL